MELMMLPYLTIRECVVCISIMAHLTYSPNLAQIVITEVNFFFSYEDSVISL